MRVPDLSPAREELEWEMIRLRLDQMLALGLRRLPAAPPEPVRELTLELTHRCNLKCVMCEHWEVEHLDPGSVAREMSFEALTRAVAASTVLETVTTIVLTGGEPWLRHDFVEIVAWLSARFPGATIVALTNLWNTGHMRLKLSQLRERGVRNLKLGSSLDGLGATHDRIRGQEGAFDGLVRTVKALREEFPELSYGFTYTILPENAGELLATHRFVADELGAALAAQWVVPTPGVAQVVWTDAARTAALVQIRAVLLDLCRRRGALARMRRDEAGNNQGLWSELLYWRYLEEYGREPRRFDFFKRCTAGERHVMLDPEGAVFFCPVNRAMTVGDAGAEGVDAAWRSAKAEETRRFIDSCRCHCWLRCVATPALDRLLRLAFS